MSENPWHWANPEHKNGAADEIDNALTLTRCEGIR
jgi:hypothetical protein